MSETRRALHHYLGPRYWLTWLLLGLVRMLCLLPYRPLMATGTVAGRLARRILRDRRHVAERNIERCLPELDAEEREALLRRHFESLGKALFETGLAWWAGDKRLGRLCHVEGLEHLDTAMGHGRGVIVLGAHFTCLEICSRMLAMQTPIHPVYRGLKNPILQEIMLRGRDRASAGIISKNDIRQMVRVLRSNGVVWYAPDQSHSGRNSRPVPFFGIPAETNTATTRLAKLTGAPVLPFLPWRLRDGTGYRIVIGPPLDPLPSDDEVADALLFHRLIEERVRDVPEQYLWIHRRFKNIDGQEDFYA